MVAAQEEEREKLRAELEQARHQVSSLMHASPQSPVQTRFPVVTVASSPLESACHLAPHHEETEEEDGSSSRPVSLISDDSSESTDPAQESDSQPAPSGDDSCELVKLEMSCRQLF